MQYKIIYKYNLIRDFRHSFDMIVHARSWNPEGVRVFWPNPLRWLWLMWWHVTNPKPVIEESKQYTVYFVHAGCWGEYRPDRNEVIICPWKVDESIDKTLEELINHELTHLEHPEADDWAYGEKEDYIEQF